MGRAQHRSASSGRVNSSPSLQTESIGESGCAIRWPSAGRVPVLSRQLLESLLTLLDQLETEARIEWVLFEGTGAGAFSGGADLEEISRLSPLEAYEYSRLGQRVTERIDRFDKPTGALIEGYALGGGFDLALSCDLVAAREDAQLGHPGLQRGLFTGWGGTRRVGQRLGTASVHRVFLFAESLSAAAAYRAGLISWIGDETLGLRHRLVAALGLISRWPASERRTRRGLRQSRQPHRWISLQQRWARVDTR